ncbi:hypothetical protein [Haloferula sp.]|uniref:hypothetical protein n=1 Tax=Haloferula sp. TaxID=2497595 RepID=UPI00329F718C
MNSHRSSRSSSAGFALIVTISILVLLGALAVGLLSLSTVSLRQSSASSGRQEARANARLALMLALGELQKTAGPDTRITAPAEAVAGKNGSRQLTGVWRSWEGADRNTRNGFPIAPPYPDKLATGDSSDSADSGRFLRWLISERGNSTSVDAPPTLLAGTGKIPLVSSGSLGSGNDALEVHLTPTVIDGRGKYGWWVQGENSKALLKQPKANPADAEEWSERMASYGQADVTNFGLDSESGLERAVSLGTLDIASTLTPDLSQQHFHDITSYARGLLTNASNGGWKRDLSLMSERWARLGRRSPLTVHTLEPGVEYSARKLRSGQRNPSAGDLIYPWAGQGDPSNEVNPSFFIPCATASWENLVDFTQQYRDIRGQHEGAPLIQMNTTRWDYEARDEVKRFPLAARIHYVISMGAESAGSDLYTPTIVMEPIVTMWNPYNLALNVSQANTEISTYAPTPLSFQVQISNGESFKINLKDLISGPTQKTIFYKVPLSSSGAGTRWAPGEVRVYSAANLAGINTITQNNPKIQFQVGYRTTGGFMFPLHKRGEKVKPDGSATEVSKRIKLPASNTFTITKITTDAVARGGYIGSRHEFKDPKQGWGYRFTTLLDSSKKGDYWGDEVKLEPPPQVVSLGSLSNERQPFVTAIYGLRTSIDMFGGGDFHTSPALFDMNPLNAHYVMSSADSTEVRLEANPYEWIFKAISDRADNNAPSGTPNETEGYLGTSFRSSEGFSNLIINELPIRPIQSLGELQHFNITAPSTAPPFAFNPIGNSLASPSIASDLVSRGGSAASNMSYDHSYISNQLLFDDWFVSSIAPQKSGYPTGTINEDVKEIYEAHLTGEQSLPNSAYLPLEIYSSAEAAEAAGVIDDNDAWKSISSELVVDGMFNVNSTSVTAWKALFLHLKDAEVPTQQPGAIGLDQSDGTAVTRNLMSSASDTTSTLSSAGLLKSFARFTDDEIEQLAQYVVEEVKLRGPFLSLSEFLNRQLTSGDAALAGTLEAALRQLTRAGSSNHLATLNSSFGEIGDLANVPESYQFPEAKDVQKAYGFPGWVRQADLLRPLAPIISVRDDTFLIRTYGESASGKERAWCEAIVERTAEYVDPADAKTILPSEDTLSSDANKIFGRKFNIVSFRWLHPSEV